MIATQAQDADADDSTASTLQQALSGQLNASGQIISVHTGCTADSIVTVVAKQLPADFGSATVYCKLVSQQSIDAWQNINQVCSLQHAVIINIAQKAKQSCASQWLFCREV